ncbi:hypothetical protein M409DRAFT_65392 [Zasmidium cellare ATCC 36951]|uniref:Major facilitator superfamily transporter n=1 Tax=Zasmidium cellare ATCC 36951 TaxID=1080233 RepID=A0A6A6CNZ1_ZASCE|nr:uncharacterized protein M409DRAFT_65392 [Zasmidium cellare ATCC 36951]KAF2168373.1 hypothetical protein M409DRAFT_65392 [Zasmidium cellare ATCC 36951]
MRERSSWRDWNPLRRFQHGRYSYQQIPSLSVESLNGAFQLASQQWPQNTVSWRERRRKCGIAKLSWSKPIVLAVASILILTLLGGGGYHHHQRKMREKNNPKDVPYYWMHYLRLNGFYNGIRTLVPYSQYAAENGYNKTEPLSMQTSPEQLKLSKGQPPLEPQVYSPYPEYSSQQYLADHHTVHTCYLDEAETIPVPDIYAYPGVPQHMAEPFYGSYDTLGLEDKMCFERYGRYGPYGFGYNATSNGTSPGMNAESEGSDKIFEKIRHINYDHVDWGSAQRRCHERNKARFEDGNGKKRVGRQAYVLRTWTGYEYTPNQVIALRAMVNELSLKSGGEYDVHFLVHVKNDSIPIWADRGVYQQTLEENVPREFWGISTLWSEAQMEMYYPHPFPGNFANMAGSKVHSVYRSAHFPLQWFAQQHPEYDHFWNWEMDIRYSGHYYEFNNRIAEWARQQPRKGMWERARRFYIPKYHGSWQNFTNFVEQETADVDVGKNDQVKSGPVPIWGPIKDFPNIGMMESPEGTSPPTTYEQDNYEWGVGEDADLMVFNPIFDPATTNWVFSWDISGYGDHTLPPPPRRVAIITVARLSKRLLDTMHKETWHMRHTMFPEMWPPSVAMHHGLKAVYVPHPVYFDRDWDVGYMNGVFNYPHEIWESPFGWGEHNMLGSSFYYNSGFSGALWRRWLGQWENGEGGRAAEEAGTGRMCLRGTLHHPIKHERGPEA